MKLADYGYSFGVFVSWEDVVNIKPTKINATNAIGRQFLNVGVVELYHNGKRFGHLSFEEKPSAIPTYGIRLFLFDERTTYNNRLIPLLIVTIENDDNICPEVFLALRGTTLKPHSQIDNLNNLMAIVLDNKCL